MGQNLRRIEVELEDVEEAAWGEAILDRTLKLALLKRDRGNGVNGWKLNFLPISYYMNVCAPCLIRPSTVSGLSVRLVIRLTALKSNCT